MSHNTFNPFVSHTHEWTATLNTDKEKVAGAQLFTRDGSRIGNAHITAILEKHGIQLFTIMTDAGDTALLTEIELDTAFTVGNYICNPEEVIQRFGRQSNDPAMAVIHFALSLDTYNCFDVLTLWTEKKFEAIRKDWPEAPDEIFIGVEPSFQPYQTKE